MFGTRPEAIKLAPLVTALRRRRVELRLITTGQHALDLADHGLAGHAHEALDCPGQPDPDRHVEAVARAVAPLLAERPALLVVQGDTSSAYGGALAAQAAGVPLAHVEAGLRTFDPALPWPEEGYRCAIDAAAQLLFAPTEISAANLAAEGVAGRVFVTGNTGIDALVELLAAIETPRLVADRGTTLLVTCHRRESWGDGLDALAAALVELTRRHPLQVRLVLHPNPVVARSISALLEGKEGIRLLPPLPHRAMIEAMLGADLVLSDSGGVQEEAPALGVPLLILRDKTERPEGLATGTMILVGTDRDRIVAGVERLLDPAVRAAMSRRSFPFGDGTAGERIAGHVLDFLAAAGAAAPGEPVRLRRA